MTAAAEPVAVEELVDVLAPAEADRVVRSVLRVAPSAAALRAASAAFFLASAFFFASARSALACFAAFAAAASRSACNW